MNDNLNSIKINNLEVYEAGKYIKTNSNGSSLVEQTSFDEYGTKSAEKIRLLPLEVNITSRDGEDNESCEWSGLVFGYGWISADTQLIRSAHFKTGETSATRPIVYKIYKGIDNTGELYYSKVFESCLFMSNSDIELNFNDSLYADNNSQFYTEISSLASFSLKTNANNIFPYRKISRWILKKNNIISLPAWEEREYLLDEKIIENNREYICVVSGIQTGSFSMNERERWKNLDNFHDHENMEIINNIDLFNVSQSVYYTYNDLGIMDTDIPTFDQLQMASCIHNVMKIKSVLNLEVSAYGFENLIMSMPSASGILTVTKNNNTSTWEWIDMVGVKSYATFSVEDSLWSGWKSVMSIKDTSLKQDIYSGITNKSAGQSVSIAHGLNIEKIKDVRVTVNTGSYIILPHHKIVASGYEYELFVDVENVVIKNSGSNSKNITGMPFNVILSSLL